MSAKDMDDISAALQALKFRKRLFGGVDERDVWRQLDGLQKEYRRVYELQEARYQALLEDREKTIQALRENGGSAAKERVSACGYAEEERAPAFKKEGAGQCAGKPGKAEGEGEAHG